MLVYYAIRQKSTGYFLPGYGSRKGRGGYTHDEPVPAVKAPPRLFMKRHLAESALKWWLEGAWTEVTCERGAPDNPYLDVERKARKIPTRSADDMEIVGLFVGGVAAP